jgi:hypothetical protein
MPDADGSPEPLDPRTDAVSGEPGTPAGAPPATTGEVPAAQPVPHAGLRYAVLRIAMLVTVGGVLALVGMRGWLLLFTAVLVSAVLSFFVFARQREAAARNLEASLARRQAQDAKWRAAAEGSRPAPQAPVTDAGQDPGPQV